MARRPKLLYLVSEDWYFVSHRMALAVAAKAAGFDVVVAARIGQHANTIRDAGLGLAPISLARSGVNPLHELKTLRELRPFFALRHQTLFTTLP